MKLTILILAVAILIINVVAVPYAGPKISPSGVNWTIPVGSQIHGITNGTAAQDAMTVSQGQIDCYTFAPTGNATLDTAAMNFAFQNYPNVKLQPYMGVKYKINSAVHVKPLFYDPRGRTVDFNNAIIECVENAGVYPTNCFVFESGGYPNGLRNTNIRGAIFDGQVNESFLKIQGSATWGVTVEDFACEYDAIAADLVEFNSNTTGANMGALRIQNIASYSHVKNTINFSVDAGCDGGFDDVFIRNIDSSYNDSGNGSAILLGDNCMIVYSDLGVIFKGGKGHAISGGDYSQVSLSTIGPIYMEPRSDVAYALAPYYLLKDNIRSITIRILEEFTSTPRAIRSYIGDCNVDNVWIVNNTGTEVNTIFVEELPTSTRNTYTHIGTDIASDRIDPATEILESWYAGFFGLGTGAPTSRLDVRPKSGSTTAATFATYDFDVGSAGSSIQFDFGAASGNTYSKISALTNGATAWGNLVLQSGGGRVGIGTTSPTSVLHVVGLPVYANNAAAVAGGLTAGAMYRTNGDPDAVCVVH